jgi:hypothetical protein
VAAAGIATRLAALTRMFISMASCSDLARVVIDTTVQPKAVMFPTDSSSIVMTLFSGLVYRLTWRLPLAGLIAFNISHLQFSQIRGRQPYSIVRKIP